MTGPASPLRNCATWAFGNKDRGETRFRQTGAGLTMLPRPGTFVCVKDSYGTLPRDGGGFCHRPRFRGRKGNSPVAATSATSPNDSKATDLARPNANRNL